MYEILDHEELKTFFENTAVHISKDLNAFQSEYSTTSNLVISIRDTDERPPQQFEMFKCFRAGLNRRIIVRGLNPVKSPMTEVMSIYRPFCESVIKRFVELTKMEQKAGLTIFTEDLVMTEMLFKHKFHLMVVNDKTNSFRADLEL